VSRLGHPATLLKWLRQVSGTYSGLKLGPDTFSFPLYLPLALKSITLLAAYPNDEEANRGSIANGKLADLAILDKNPLKVPTAALAGLKVILTIQEGQTICKVK
jgi:predicted amidohydrolase YtcJ